MNAFIIARRELSVFFISPIAYITGATFLFITGLIFFFTIALHNVATLSNVFSGIAITLIFVAPLLTRHLLSTEAQSGTLELLVTAPVHNWEVVIGKFLAAFLLFLTVLAPTLSYLVLLVCCGNPDILVTLSGYLGVILLGAMLVSVGVLTSALSTNQMVAAILAVVLSIFFWLVGGLGAAIDGLPGYFLAYLSSQGHFTDFVLGLITTNNVVYFLSVTIGALFITTRILEVRRWR
jgi:ABC-2 type transport system permease protein